MKKIVLIGLVVASVALAGCGKHHHKKDVTTTLCPNGICTTTLTPCKNFHCEANK
jgi:hypothetical protein